MCEGGLGDCGGRMLVGWYEGLLAEGFRWWRLRGACWGWAGSCVGGGAWLDAEAVEGGLVAGGWREMVSCTVSAFGGCWGGAGCCGGGGAWLDAEAVEGGLVAGGWREWISCTVGAFGVCRWDGVVICVD